MRQLITQARNTLDQLTGAGPACDGDCSNCLIKRIESLELELTDWDRRLLNGETPRLGDLHRLGQQGRTLVEELIRHGDLPARVRAAAATR